MFGLLQKESWKNACCGALQSQKWLNRLLPRKQKKLGEKVVNLYKTNKLAAEDVSQLLQTADEAGLEFPNPIKKKKSMPAKGSESEESRDKNAARSMDRHLRKTHQWPDLYWAQIPMKNPKKKNHDLSQQWLPFLLPHECLGKYFTQPNAWKEGMPTQGTFNCNRLNEACASNGNPPMTMYPMGLHGDGAPVQGRMNQSTLEFWSFNLPCSKTFSAMRIPTRCLDTRMIAPDTIQAICEILLWSFDRLNKGIYPTARHDGSPWLKHDAYRKFWAGAALPGKATLIQIRSDCKYFGAGQWNEKKGCCWLCQATPDNWREMSQSMARLEQSLDKANYLAFLEDRDKPINPLFQLPNVSNKTLMPDWMHVCDEGCLAVAAGQILKELLPSFPGTSQDERCANLWQEVQKMYDDERGWPACKRLKKLTLKDIVKPKKVPELDCKAHEVRHFCPLLEPLCKRQCLHEGNWHQKAVYKVAKYCSHMYDSLEVFNKKSLVKAGRKFISQYMALEGEVQASDGSKVRIWRSKPKLHYLAHILDLVKLGNHPKDSWNYKDETFAGTLHFFNFS